jgi:ferrochelatase
MEAGGVSRAVGIVMAPHYSRMSIGAYQRKVIEAGSGIDVRLIESWHLMPEYLATVLDLIEKATRRFPESQRRTVPIIFTVHSLPERILADGDPYAAQFQATVEALRMRLDGRPCHLAYQSAAMTAEPWLGPDAGDVLERLAAEYDIDIEYRDLAERLGVRLERIDMMNDHPLMMRGLARLVRDELERAHWL